MQLSLIIIHSRLNDEVADNETATACLASVGKNKYEYA